MGYSSGKDSDYGYSSRSTSSGKDSDSGCGSKNSSNGSCGKDSGYGSSSRKDSDNSTTIISNYVQSNGYIPSRPSSKLAFQLIKAIEEKQNLEEQRIKNETEIAKADKKVQELILKLKDDPNLSDIVDRFNRLLVLR